MRPLINAVLGLGYVLGLLLIWVSVKMLILERSNIAGAVLGIAIGVSLWAGLVAVGKQSRQLQCDRASRRGALRNSPVLIAETQRRRDKPGSRR